MADPDDSLEIRIRMEGKSNSVEGGYRKDIGFFGPDSKPLLAGVIPSRGSAATQLAAVVHRFGRKMPEGDRQVKDDFVEYSKLFIETHMKPVELDRLKTFDDWLKGMDYDERRKEELREVMREKTYQTNEREVFSESFIKWESYDAPKNARAINALSDHCKVLFGPAFNAIDKATFETLDSRFFIKGTHPSALPARMEEKFGTRPVIETDFTSFESHHRGVFVEVIRHWMMHMARNLKAVYSRGWFELLSRVVLGVNLCKFRCIDCKLDETLMSGASWTSSSNGVLNLLIMSYLNLRATFPEESAQELVCRAASFNCLVEGDDGICETDSRLDKVRRASLIEGLGIKLEFSDHDRYGEAGFCGMLMSSDGVVLTDPWKFMRKFFLMPAHVAAMSSKKQLAFLRCKALSALHQYDGVPVVSVVAKRVCDITASYDTRSVSREFNLYEREILTEAAHAWRKEVVISDVRRQDVCVRFGMPIALQEKIERDFTSSVRCVIDLSVLSDFDMAHRRDYVSDCPGGAYPRYYTHDRITKVLSARGWQKLEDSAGRTFERTDSRALKITKRFAGSPMLLRPTIEYGQCDSASY